MDTLAERGYRVSLDPPDLVVRGPGPVPNDLRRRILADTAAMKAAALLRTPPPWLVVVLDMYASGKQMEVRRTIPKADKQPQLGLGDATHTVGERGYPDNLRGGKVVRRTVRASLETIAVNVATEIGLAVSEWEKVLPEVREVAEAWEVRSYIHTLKDY
jgi:hypothetical protein